MVRVCRAGKFSHSRDAVRSGKVRLCAGFPHAVT